MDSSEFKLEKDRLARTIYSIDTERSEIDARLTNGIEAANEQTEEAIAQQFLRRLRILILIKDKPYFARVDFKADSGNPEQFYIGKSTVIDKNGNAAVVDWRAPVSSLYYEGRVGKASYSCPDGEINGEILLKRQFEIEDRKLLSYNDIDITFDEELLKPYLAVNSDMRLKNIIATIQAEQNRIIRAEMIKPLIVQGVAGSGKTTVALHRIAYLIYTYASKIKPEEFLIIAPNAIFLNYISNVLPDLGVENVCQKTFEAFAQDMIGKKLKIEDPGEKLGRILTAEDPHKEISASRYKSSLLFRDAIDDYLGEIEDMVMPREDFCAGKHLLCSYDGIHAMFTEDYAKYPFAKRIDLIKERLKNLIEDQTEKIISEIDYARNQKVLKLPEGIDAEEYKLKKRLIYEEDEDVVYDLLHGGKNTLKQYFKKIRLPSALECYKKFVSELQAMPKIDEETVSYISSYSSKISKGCVEYEDLAPLVYIHNRIRGKNPAFSIKHVVIDEAQDLSEFQFLVIKEALNCNSMTIFGDIAQGIYYYRGTSDWSSVSRDVFGGNCDFAVLKKSYRSTVEIMEQANRVLSKIAGFEGSAKAVPVIRNGDPVRYVKKSGEKELVSDIAERIIKLRGRGFKNIAVICKTMRGCMDFSILLRKYIDDFHILNGKEYNGGLSIVPSYLVKGLEFDAVIISDAHNYNDDEIETKLLYVAMTRAMHCMDVYYIDKCPALNKF